MADITFRMLQSQRGATLPRHMAPCSHYLCLSGVRISRAVQLSVAAARVIAMVASVRGSVLYTDYMSFSIISLER